MTSGDRRKSLGADGDWEPVLRRQESLRDDSIVERWSCEGRPGVNVRRLSNFEHGHIQLRDDELAEMRSGSVARARSLR
jgi:hypothetical protein